MHVVLIDIFRG